MNGWAKTKRAATYAGVSERTFRDWLRSGDVQHIRLPSGTILVKLPEAVDEFLTQFVVGKQEDVQGVVDDVMRGLL